MIAGLFWVLLIASALLIAINGNPTARGFLVWVVLASASTAAVDLYASASVAPYCYLIVDGMLLLIAFRHVVTQPVYWPIWFAGFQSITVASELARLILPGPLPAMYANVAGFWAVPALVTMAVGTAKDRKAMTKPEITT